MDAMITALNAGAAVTNAARTPQPEPAREPEASGGKRAPAAAPPKSDLRLEIQRNKDDAYYVYRLVDPTTGKVVVELPKAQVSDLAQSPGYKAGAVVSTTI